MGVSLSSDDRETIQSLDTWLEANGPIWRERVRAIYGNAADDVLAMVLGGVA